MNEPVVCSLTPENRAGRKKALDELTRGIIERKELPDGMAYRYEPKAGVVSRLAELVELERACCKFLAFRINVGQADGPVWLEIRGPEGTKALIREYFTAK